MINNNNKEITTEHKWKHTKTNWSIKKVGNGNK